MTKLDNIKAAFSKPKPEEENTDLGGLRTAMDAAASQMKREEQIEAEALSQEIESAISLELAKEMPVLDSVEPNSTQKRLDDAISERLLCLQRKQGSVVEMRGHIKDGKLLLDRLSDKSEQLVDYLAKCEVEIAKLEDTENKYKKLSEASKKMAQEHRKLKSELADKNQQINMLEITKNNNRDKIEKVQAEIDSLGEQIKAQLSDIRTRDAAIVKLKSKSEEYEEKYALVVSENNEYVSIIKDLEDRSLLMSNQISEHEKVISRQSLRIDTQSNEISQYLLELQDVQNINSISNEKCNELKAELEETKYQLEAERTGFEEKIRLKNSRIKKLEQNLEVLTRQLSLSEDLSANLKHELEVEHQNSGTGEESSRNVIPMQGAGNYVSANELVSSKM
ncbi:MAG: hypothetical protein ACR2O3_13410 [Rhizobiaceae bacterium]